MRHLFFTFFICVIYSCGSNNNDLNKEDLRSENTSKETPKNEQLNLSVLLDLSDRVDPTINPDKPEHYQKDVEIIRTLARYFADRMDKQGAFMSKGKFRVLFSPRPEDPNINSLAQRLSVDLSPLQVKEKKKVYDSLEGQFVDASARIYESTLQTQKWLGSDIWRFFKNDVKDLAVVNDPNYRNVLVVLTDGYIYHKDSKEKKGNRYTYLLPNLLSQHNIRQNQDWERELETQDFGLIPVRNDLKDLEVLVLEINPSKSYKGDEDIIKKVLAKWFNEMKVKKFAIYNSDLPEYTKQRIFDFLGNP